MARLLYTALKEPVTFFLLGVGAALILSQIAVYRLQYLYVGFWGLAMLAGGLKRSREWSPPIETTLFFVIVFSVGYAAALMIQHSVSNWRDYEARRKQRFEQLMAEIQALKKEKGNGQRATGNGEEASDE